MVSIERSRMTVAVGFVISQAFREGCDGLLAARGAIAGREVVDGFENEIIEVEAVLLEVVEETALSTKGLRITEKAAVLVVKERAAVRSRFTNKERGDAARGR